MLIDCLQIHTNYERHCNLKKCKPELKMLTFKVKAVPQRSSEHVNMFKRCSFYFEVSRLLRE